MADMSHLPPAPATGVRRYQRVVDVFVRDRQLGTTERISVSSSGGQGNGDSRNPAIAPMAGTSHFLLWPPTWSQGDSNGAYDIFVHDRQTGATER
jgi:hypothetical protein